MTPLRWGRTSLVGGLALALVLSCGAEPESTEKRFELSGQVVTVDEKSHRLTIAHEDIPGFMPAMTMPFTVKDEGVLKSVAAGDVVEATLVVTEESSWLQDLVISHKGVGGDALEPPPPIPGEPSPGDVVPDFRLINQHGQIIRLEQYRGQALVVTFIYTRCPLPEYCPRMTSHFARLDRALDDEPELRDKTHLLTVSFDPDHDTPTVLKQYAITHAPDPENSFEHWEFATGDPEELKEMTRFFGLTYTPEKGRFLHSLRTAVVGTDGRLFKLYRGNEWEPSDILNDLRRLELGTTN